MKVVIEEIVRRLHLLPEAKLQEVLDFVTSFTSFPGSAWERTSGGSASFVQ